MRNHRSTALGLAALMSLAVAAGCGGDDKRTGSVRVDPPSNVDTTDDDMGGGANSNAGEDMDSAMNAVTNDDMGSPDTGGSSDDFGMMPDFPEPPTGEMCGYTDLTPFIGACDPVRLTGCRSTEHCVTALLVVGTAVTVSSACVESDVHVLETGSECVDAPESCVPGDVCVSSFRACKRLCYPDTALGCEPGEFCRRPSVTWEGIGFCDTTCNL